MKKINCILILSITFLASCMVDYLSQVDFVFDNKTDYPITMNIMPLLYDSIYVLESNTTKVISYERKGKFNEPPRIDPFQYPRDSVTFSIGDSISYTYIRNNTSEYNPLNVSNYILTKSKSGSYFKYTYTFTNDNISKILGQ